MSIFYLCLASLFEAVWIISLRFVSGTHQFLMFIVTFIALLLSVWFLHKASTTIPLAIAYAVWVTLGLMGLLLFDHFVFDHPLQLNHFVGCLLVGFGIMTLKANY